MINDEALIWFCTKRPHCMLAPATPTISGFTAREMSQPPTRLHGRRGGCSPFQYLLTAGHPPLTLRGLSLFFKILPISNTGVSIACILATVHFLYHKPVCFSNMEYYFYQLAYQDSKVPKRFVGLNQMQCSPSFDWNWGKQNDPTACWLRPRFRVLQQGKCLSYPPERVGGVTETANCVGGEGATPSSNLH